MKRANSENLANSAKSTKTEKPSKSNASVLFGDSAQDKENISHHLVDLADTSPMLDESKTANRTIDPTLPQPDYPFLDYMWLSDNIGKTNLPDIYPDSGYLSSRDRPKLKVIPYDLHYSSIYESYLFPQYVRDHYEEIAREWAEKHINNPDTPERVKSRYVYNKGVLCVPECHMPYYYDIFIFGMSSQDFNELWKRIQDMEKEAFSKMSDKERQDYEDWRELYKANGYKLEIYKNHIWNSYGISEMFTESTIEYIAGLKEVKYVRVQFWKPVYDSPSKFNCQLIYD